MTQFKEAVQIAKNAGFKITNQYYHAGYQILKGDNEKTIRVFCNPELTEIKPIVDHFISLGWTDITDQFSSVINPQRVRVVLELLEVK
jgi:hypothetical protein